MDCNKKTLVEYFQAMISEELICWASRVCMPLDITVERIDLMPMEHRHKANGVGWKAEFTGGLTATGWISLDGLQFDMDQRPDG